MKTQLALLGLTFLLSSHGFAQSEKPQFGVHLTSVTMSPDDDETLVREVASHFANALQKRGIPSRGLYQVMLLVDATEIADRDEREVSVTTMERLPDAVVEMGAQQEAFYLAWDRSKLPDDGSMIRQYVSRDWLEQYHSVRAQYLRVIPRAQLEAVAEEIVAAVVSPPER